MPGETRTPLRSPRSQVLQWGHASHITAHPGARRTLEFVQRHFWWPGMAKDVKSLVGDCSVCIRVARGLMCLHCLHCRLTARRSWVQFPHGALLALGGRSSPECTVLGWAISRAFLCGVCMFSPCSQGRSEEQTSELQSHLNLVCRLL